MGGRNGVESLAGIKWNTQFIRRGMLAWIEITHRCISVTPNLEKRAEQPVFANETTSEMIKVMANITLFNLEEALS
jgi:hypothetical protein